MPRQLTDLQQYLVDEFVEDYQHGQMSRRDALKRIAAVTGSAAFAAAILAACGPTPTATPAAAPPTAAPSPSARPATPATGATPSAAAPASAATAPPAPTSSAATRVATAIATRTVIATPATLSVTPTAGAAGAPHVAADDPAIEAMDVSFPGPVTVLAYLARPKGGSALIPILVCHENRGLTEHIRDVTRRLGKAGYLALAVDLLSEQGGTDKVADQAQIPGVLGNTPAEQFVGYFKAAITYLQGQPNVAKERFGMTGFCFGGGITWRTITKAPEIKAAVPYYGPNPPLEDVPGIQAAVLAMYGENDTRINAGIPAIEAAMKQSNKVFEKMIYPGASHAFNNDTGANYNAAAASDAWAKMLAWFQKYLKA